MLSSRQRIFSDRFDDDEAGESHCGLVQGSMRYNIETNDGWTRPGFSFEGMDEMGETTGRGRVRVEPDGTLYGKSAFH